MMTCPMFPRGPGVRSIATRSPPPLPPKTSQPGEPTRACTAPLGQVEAASCAANIHGSGRVAARLELEENVGEVAGHGQKWGVGGVQGVHLGQVAGEGGVGVRDELALQ